MTKFAPVLLLLTGALHAVPYLNTLLTEVAGGSGIIQIVVGILAVVSGLSMMKDSAEATA